MATTDSDLFRAFKNNDFAGGIQVAEIAADGLLYLRFAATTYIDNRGH